VPDQVRPVAELRGHEWGIGLEVDALDGLEREETRPGHQLERPALSQRALPRPRLRSDHGAVDEDDAGTAAEPLDLHVENDTKSANPLKP
jgi:hypothetical protein